jgi:hypothetical protein
VDRGLKPRLTPAQLVLLNRLREGWELTHIGVHHPRSPSPWKLQRWRKDPKPGEPLAERAPLHPSIVRQLVQRGLIRGVPVEPNGRKTRYVLVVQR